MTAVREQRVVPVSPPALRWRRPGWRDPRLLLGVVLIASSVAVGSWAVASAGRTHPVYAAVEPLVAGDVVDAAAVRVVQVRLDTGSDTYLAADAPLAPGLVAQRTVGAGELVPASAVVAEADLGLRPVAITPRTAVPADLAEGSTVDLWFVPAESTTAPRDDGAAVAVEPRQLAAGVTVSEVAEASSAFTVGSGSTVHVLVPLDVLPEVLQALASDGTVEVVAVPGSARR